MMQVNVFAIIVWSLGPCTDGRLDNFRIKSRLCTMVNVSVNDFPVQ